VKYTATVSAIQELLSVREMQFVITNFSLFNFLESVDHQTP